MGQGDEYSRDAYNYDLAYDSDGSDAGADMELHPEDWQDMYSHELLDGWMAILDYSKDHYLNIKGTYPEFVNLVLDPSGWYSAKEPHVTWRIMWNLISNLPIIADRVQPQNFYAWAENYVGYL